MIKIGITEKLWDGVRPSSVKKTGLSEVIRTSTKTLAKALQTPKDYDEADAAIVALDKAIGEAAAAVKKCSDDKKGAAAKLKDWGDECEQARKALATQRQQAAIIAATVEADRMLKDKLKDVQDAIVAAGELERTVKAGQMTDIKKATTQLQTFRDAMRDGLKVVQKDGFAEFIKQFEQPRTWGLDSKLVPMSPVAKTLKAELPALQAAAEKAREAVEGLVNAAGQQRVGDVAELAKPLIKAYKEMNKKIKGFLGPAKKFSSDVHAVADKFKTLIAKGQTADKLLPIALQLHEKALEAERKTLEELARGRRSSGDVQALRIKLRDSLEGKPRQEFEGIASEEWNLIMVTFREVSEQMADCHRQVQRVMRLIGDISEEARTVADQAADKCQKEVMSMRNSFAK